jgi:hypothetical protein
MHLHEQEVIYNNNNNNKYSYRQAQCINSTDKRNFTDGPHVIPGQAEVGNSQAAGSTSPRLYLQGHL